MISWSWIYHIVAMGWTLLGHFSFAMAWVFFLEYCRVMSWICFSLTDKYCAPHMQVAYSLFLWRRWWLLSSTFFIQNGLDFTSTFFISNWLDCTSTFFIRNGLAFTGTFFICNGLDFTTCNHIGSSNVAQHPYSHLSPGVLPRFVWSWWRRFDTIINHPFQCSSWKNFTCIASMKTTQRDQSEPLAEDDLRVLDSIWADSS